MLVQVYGNNAMKETSVYKWVKSFSDGKESVNGEEIRMASNKLN